jgi:hypothetical protein
MMIRLALIPFFMLVAACAEKPQACRGLVSVDAVNASRPVIEAFRSHLASKAPTTDTGKFLADYRNYDLAITMSDSQFEYEFLPRAGGHSFKGGGAFYTVDRASGKIEDERFMK